MNSEDCQIAGNNPAALKMAESYNIQFPRSITAFKLKQQFSSQLIKGNLTVKQLGADYLISNQIMRIKGHCNLLGLTNPHCKFPRSITAFKLKQQFSSQLIKGNITVKQLGADYLIPNQIVRIQGHCNLLGLTNPHGKFGRTSLKILYSAHLDPRRNCETPQPRQDRLGSLQQRYSETIKHRGEINGIRQGWRDKAQNIALPT